MRYSSRPPRKICMNLGTSHTWPLPRWGNNQTDIQLHTTVRKCQHRKDKCNLKICKVSTFSAPVSLIISVVVVRRSGAGCTAGAAILIAKIAPGTVVDALLGGLISEREGVDGAHDHTPPGRVIGKCAQGAISLATNCGIVCERVATTIEYTEVNEWICVGVFGCTIGPDC